MKRICFLFILLFCLGMEMVKAQYKVLLNFNDTNGFSPKGSLILSGSLLYGMVSAGNIFSIHTDGSGYKELYTFAGKPSITGSLIKIGKKFYGMTYIGGTNTSGNIFAIDTDGKNYKNLFDFNGGTGAGPVGSLAYSSGVLYGMTILGGSHLDGTIFSIDMNGTNFKSLLEFDYTNGLNPYGSLLLAGKVLYGTTSGGGVNNEGCIFRIDTDGTKYKDLYDFTLLTGETPVGSLVRIGKVLYGMAFGGANYNINAGCIFSIDTNGSNYKDMFDFDGITGCRPRGDLTLYGDRFYAMTLTGGINGKGNIFSIDTTGHGFREIFDFNGTNGKMPYSDLSYVSGVLYGMASGGGADTNGVVFKVDTTGIAGINNISIQQHDLKSYPNPSNGQFTFVIASEAKQSLSIIEVYNVLGEKVYSQFSTFNSLLSINISNQPNGIYLYRVITETGDLLGQGKLIIQK